MKTALVIIAGTVGSGLFWYFVMWLCLVHSEKKNW